MTEDNDRMTGGAVRRTVGLRVKLAAAVVGAGILTAAATGTVGYLNARAALDGQAQAKLAAIAADHTAAFTDYLRSIEADMHAQAANPAIGRALDGFGAAWDALGPQAPAYLQQAYITDNPHPTGAKDQLERADDGSAYSAVHADYHPYLRRFMADRGYYDLFLFNADGDLVYSVFKELDYATNVVDGAYADSGLGQVFREAAALQLGDLAFVDFAPYAPSHGAPASFIATPLVTPGGERGVLAFQMPVDRINALMNQATGLGDTGESYLVGADGLMRSDSRLIEAPTLLEWRVDSAAVDRALAGQAGLVRADDHRGVAATIAYEPVDFLGTRWAVLTSQADAEVFAAAADLLRDILILVVGIMAVATVGGWLLARSVSRPIARMTETMGQLAAGRLETAIDGTDRGDEIGAMARAVAVFKENAVEAERLRRAQKATEERAAAERKAAMDHLADTFEGSVSAVVEKVSSAADDLGQSATSMQRMVTRSEEQASGVASAAEQATANVQSVASATEELDASIREIGGQVGESGRIAGEAGTEADQARQTVTSLVDQAESIGEVVGLITSIAEQTNLLALNATIEAARAGEAGKGFAVVAGEVKSLASQTARATEEIAEKVRAIQSVSTEAADGIDRVGAIIRRMNELSSQVAVAVEQQGDATREIARNVQEAAAGTDEVSRKIAGVGEATSATGAQAAKVLTASSDLSRQADALRDAVDRFLAGVRAG